MYISMNNVGTNAPNRAKVINTLAIVGFIALIGSSIWLAFYSTRYVPNVVGRLGSAAVYLGAVFASESGPSLSVISTPESPTTISFGEAGPAVSTNSNTETTKPTNKTITPTTGERTNSTYQIGGATTTTLSGLPDLVVNISSIGYLASTTADSFVATSTIQSNNRPAVKFTIKNVGINSSGKWRFSAYIPTQSSYLYYSPFQQSLSPGDSIDYTLGFDQAIPGSDKIISVTANFDHAVTESSTNNNIASAQLTILGS